MFRTIRFCDVSANLTDSQFRGLYDGQHFHEDDLRYVFKRAWLQGLQIIIKGHNQASSLEALAISKTDDRLFSTVGCVPQHVMEIEGDGKFESQQKYLDYMMKVVEKNPKKVVAIGEIGLDFENPQCDKGLQRKYFIMQLEVAKVMKLPVIIRCRSATEELLSILHKHIYGSAILKDFEGDYDDVQTAISLGCHFAVNGCSLKRKEFREVLKTIPTELLVFSSDAPYCPVNPGEYTCAQYMKTTFPTEKKKKWTPEKMVRGRNEPANIVQVVEVAAALRNESHYELGFQAYKTSKTLFFSSLDKYN